MKKGLVIILSGASSVGKRPIRTSLMQDPELNLFYSVSMTTRPKKEKEIDGIDYYFVSHEGFAQAVKNQELLEFTEFNGYYYGTPKHQVEFLIDQGKNVLIEVEAQGVGPIKLNIPEALSFFIMPETFEDLEKQINLIYKDDEANIKNRLNKARMDMQLATIFKNVVSTKDVNLAVNDIKAKIILELNKGN